MSPQRSASRTAPLTPHFIPLQQAIHIVAKQKPDVIRLKKKYTKKKLKSLRMTTFRFLSLLLPPFCYPILKQTLIAERVNKKTTHPLSLATVSSYRPSNILMRSLKKVDK